MRFVLAREGLGLGKRKHHRRRIIVHDHDLYSGVGPSEDEFGIEG